MSSSDKARLIEDLTNGPASSPDNYPDDMARHISSPIDINQLLFDKDEQEVAPKDKVIFIDSAGEEVETEEEDQTESAASSSDSAVSSPHPYIHPTILLHEQDIDYPEEMSEDDRIKERRRLGKISLC